MNFSTFLFRETQKKSFVCFSLSLRFFFYLAFMPENLIKQLININFSCWIVLDHSHQSSSWSPEIDLNCFYNLPLPGDLSSFLFFFISLRWNENVENSLFSPPNVISFLPLYLSQSPQQQRKGKIKFIFSQTAATPIVVSPFLSILTEHEFSFDAVARISELSYFFRIHYLSHLKISQNGIELYWFRVNIQLIPFFLSFLLSDKKVSI